MPDWLRKARDSWSYRGQRRPPFAVEPQEGQESVWDYPRPPALVPDTRRVRVQVGDTVIADSAAAMRLCETASPPTFYIPATDVSMQHLQAAAGSSFCEWKGKAKYWRLSDALAASLPQAQRARSVAWCYPEPRAEYGALAGYLAFYPALCDCVVGEHRVTAQAGSFYGGWITPEIVGPFKGEPGTQGW